MSQALPDTSSTHQMQPGSSSRLEEGYSAAQTTSIFSVEENIGSGSQVMDLDATVGGT